MTTRRVLCGWINLDERVASQDALAAMLAAEGSHRHRSAQTSEAGVLACTHPAGEQCGRPALGQHGRAARGNPRWPDARLAMLAPSEGHAAAPLDAWRNSGEAALETIQGSFTLVPSTALATDPARGRPLRSGAPVLRRRGRHAGFSTSARAVARHPPVAATIDRQALYEYLYCHMVPSPDTAFAGVEKLLPAQCASFSGGRLERRFYWQLPYAPEVDADEASLRKRFLDLTEQAVARQYDEKRSTSAFRPAARDSSTVSGMLREGQGQPAHLPIGFRAEGFDEIEYARITSRHFGTEAHEYYVTADDIVKPCR